MSQEGMNRRNFLKGGIAAAALSTIETNAQALENLADKQKHIEKVLLEAAKKCQPGRTCFALQDKDNWDALRKQYAQQSLVVDTLKNQKNNSALSAALKDAETEAALTKGSLDSVEERILRNYDK
jgi:hypothetical protein